MSKYRIKKVVEGTDVEYYLQERFWFFWWTDLNYRPFNSKRVAIEDLKRKIKREEDIKARRTTYEKITHEHIK
jgi:hypothetical protein